MLFYQNKRFPDPSGEKVRARSRTRQIRCGGEVVTRVLQWAVVSLTAEVGPIDNVPNC